MSDLEIKSHNFRCNRGYIDTKKLNKSHVRTCLVRYGAAEIGE